MRWLIVTAVLTGLIVLAACSRSPVDGAIETANAVSQRFMGNLVEKDASHQTEALIRNIVALPECQTYIDEFRRAGRGSPYEGATEWAITHAYDEAGKAGCVRPGGG